MEYPFYVLRNSKTRELAAPAFMRTTDVAEAEKWDNAGAAARYKRSNMVRPEEWSEERVGEPCWIAREEFKGFAVTQGFKTREEATARLASTLAHETAAPLLLMELRHGESIANSVLHYQWKRGEGVTFERKQEAR